MLIYIHTSEREFLVKTIMNIIKTIKNSSILRGESPIAKSIFAVAIIALCLLGIVMPNATNADFASPANATYVVKYAGYTQKAVKTISVVITAYSSTPDQTDDTPFVTASGKCVGDGIIANNMLPFGTRVRIPELYGDKVFTVQDRMASYKSNYHIDIWFPDRPSAVKFGVKTAKIEVLES